MKNLIILCFESLVVRVGQIFVHIICTNLLSVPNGVLFSVAVTCIKGFKCLDIATGRIYVSRDVIFDEQVFPFAALHDNAGARLRSEIELLSPTLFDPSMLFGSTAIPADVVNRSTNPPANSGANSNLSPEENPTARPIFHGVLQEETSA
jgi:hypothetical protein